MRACIASSDVGFCRSQYTLQMLDQDIMQAKLEGHDEPSFARAGITV